jgi:hypothetical protein
MSCPQGGSANLWHLQYELAIRFGPERLVAFAEKAALASLFALHARTYLMAAS